jgi:hypothetical protein
MIKWLKNILGLCEHKTEIIEKYFIKDPSDFTVVGIFFISRCLKCGHLFKDQFTGRP